MSIRTLPLSHWRAFTITALLTAAFGLGSHSVRAEEVPSKAAPIAWTDLSGQHYDLNAFGQAKATVFFFVSTQCPIANLYTPRFLELAKDYTPRGVRFFLVDSNTSDSAAAVKKYARERAFPFPVVKDSGTALADRLGALATPEAIIVDATGAVRYLGRIDDNVDRSKVVRKDVREALDALLAGREIDHARTLTFGCAIFRDSPAIGRAPAGKSAITYTRNIAPILNANCVVCHRAGEVAPFGLETYAQARTWASSIKDYTARKLMPPWKPEPGFGDFHDARFLTPQQITLIAQWADAGAPQGNPKDLPPPPHFPAPDRWTLGKPDMIIQPDRPYHLTAEGKDVYRNFVLPVDFSEDRYVSGFEFKPGNRAVVHHIVTYIDPTAASVKLDGHETEPGYTVPGTGIGVLNAEWGDVWVPGNAPRPLPSGVAIKIPKGAKLVMQVHYHKSGKPEVDRSQMALYFSKGTVEKQMITIPTANYTFALKPGLAGQKFEGSLPTFGGVLPFDVHLHSIFPHMHMLGHEMKVTATLPNGTVLPLIWIKDWDFNWQATYFYKQPIALPKGTILKMVAVYDNSEQNPHQTSHPPRTVRFGEQTTDEMCFCFLGLTQDKQHMDVQNPTVTAAP